MTLSRKELIELGERAAREAWVAQSGYGEPDFNDIVRNVFAVLNQAGMVIVPREPTTKMIEAGRNEIDWIAGPDCERPATFTTERQDTADCWKAMIEAALTDQQI